MLYRSLIGLVGAAALAMATGLAEASEDMKYPNWKGQWGRFIVRGLPGQPSFDQTEPKIIPGDRGDRQLRSGGSIRVFLDGGGVRHIYVARLGPLGMVVIALMIGVLLAITLVVLLGAFLIWIPLVGLLVAAAIISSLLRAYFRQPR